MTPRLRCRRGPTGRAVLLVLAIALIPLPALANEPAAPTAPMAQAAKPAKPAQLSLRQAIARETARTPVVLASATRKAAQGGTSSDASKGSGFLHSRPGVIALVVMAAGGGYAVYSLSHDRVKSPAK